MDNNHKIDGECEFCKEPIVKGDMTLHKTGRYLCASCQIDLNNGLSLVDLFNKRKDELFCQLGEVTFTLKQLEDNLK